MKRVFSVYTLTLYWSYLYGALEFMINLQEQSLKLGAVSGDVLPGDYFSFLSSTIRQQTKTLVTWPILIVFDIDTWIE